MDIDIDIDIVVGFGKAVRSPSIERLLVGPNQTE